MGRNVSTDVATSLLLDSSCKFDFVQGCYPHVTSAVPLVVAASGVLAQPLKFEVVVAVKMSSVVLWAVHGLPAFRRDVGSRLQDYTASQLSGP